MARLLLVLVILAGVLLVIPTGGAEAYVSGRITSLSSQTVLQIEFPQARPGIVIRIKTLDGQVTDFFRDLVGYPDYHTVNLELPNEEIAIGFYEPIAGSDSLWQDPDQDGWYTWQGPRLKAMASCFNGYLRVVVLGSNLSGRNTWLVVDGNGMEGWQVMYNGSFAGEVTYITYQGYITNVKTNQSHVLVCGEPLWFSVYEGDYSGQMILSFLAWTDIAVPAEDCPASTPVPTATPTRTAVPTSSPTLTPTATPIPTPTPLPTSLPTWTPSPIPSMVVYHIYLPLMTH